MISVYSICIRYGAIEIFNILYLFLIRWILFNLESYPHSPKLNNLLSGNDDIIFHRDLSPSPNVGAKLILDSILLRIMFTWIY